MRNRECWRRICHLLLYLQEPRPSPSHFRFLWQQRSHVLLWRGGIRPPYWLQPPPSTRGKEGGRGGGGGGGGAGLDILSPPALCFAGRAHVQEQSVVLISGIPRRKNADRSLRGKLDLLSVSNAVAAGASYSPPGRAAIHSSSCLCCALSSLDDSCCRLPTACLCGNWLSRIDRICTNQQPRGASAENVTRRNVP